MASFHVFPMIGFIYLSRKVEKYHQCWIMLYIYLIICFKAKENWFNWLNFKLKWKHDMKRIKRIICLHYKHDVINKNRYIEKNKKIISWVNTVMYFPPFILCIFVLDLNPMPYRIKMHKLSATYNIIKQISL